MKEKKSIPSSPELNEAEELIYDVHRLLVQSEGALKDEGVKKHAESLEAWLDAYHRGVSAAQKLSEKGDDYLNEMKERLNLALHEIHRLEGEGGNLAATAAQKKRTEELTQAIDRIDALKRSLSETSFKLEDTQVH